MIFLWFSLSIRFLWLILKRPAKLCHLIIYKKGGAVMGGYIHIERRNCALVFDSVELRNFHRIVRKQSNGAPHWVYCIQLVLCPFVTIVGDSWIWEGIYIYAQRGAGRCSFRQFGQCEGLTEWNEWQDLLHVLCLCMSKTQNVNRRIGAYRQPKVCWLT